MCVLCLDFLVNTVVKGGLGFAAPNITKGAKTLFEADEENYVEDLLDSGLFADKVSYIPARPPAPLW